MNTKLFTKQNTIKLKKKSQVTNLKKQRNTTNSKLQYDIFHYLTLLYSSKILFLLHYMTVLFVSSFYKEKGR